MSGSPRRGRQLGGVVSFGSGVAMLVALGSSLLYIAWVASIRDADQIGQLAFATIIATPLPKETTPPSWRPRRGDPLIAYRSRVARRALPCA